MTAGEKKNNNPVPTQNDQDCRGCILFPVNEQESLSELMLSARVSAKQQLSGEGGKMGNGLYILQATICKPCKPKAVVAAPSSETGSKNRR